jgi:hypothetical protein
MGLLKKLYNAWASINTAEKANLPSVTIVDPAVSIVGACTPQSFFENLLPSDVEGGFANRLMLLPFEGARRPVERDVPEGADEVPKGLVERLKRLAPPSILDKLEGKDGSVPPAAREKIDWADDEAKAAYFAFSAEMDAQEEVSPQRYELAMRTAENAVRCATIMAVGRGATKVDEADMRWAIDWARVSFEAAAGGFAKYMRQHFTFGKFCDEVHGALVAAGGWMSNRDIQRRFGRNQRFGNELARVLDELKAEERIAPSGRGRSANGWEVVD